MRRAVLAAVAALAFALPALPALPALAQQGGMVTRQGAHDVRTTIDRFFAAVRESGWVVFAEIDHAAAAQAVGMTLRPRTVVFFGNPRAGTPGMVAHPTLALDLPMRVLIWQDNDGRTQITRSTGEDLAERVFARHGVTIPPEGRRNTEAFLDGLVRKAAE